MSSSEPKVNYIYPHKDCDINYIDFTNLSDDEKKVFKDSLFKSKGKSNNRLGVMLAYVGADSDTIAEYASKAKGGSMMRIMRQEKYTSLDRAVHQIVSSIPDFWETTKGKKLKATSAKALEMIGANINKPLPVTMIDSTRYGEYMGKLSKLYHTSRYVYHSAMNDVSYSSGYERQIMFAELFAGLADVKFKGKLDTMVKYTYISDVTSKVPDYKKWFDYEVDSFSHMDSEVTEKIDPYGLCCDAIVGAFKNSVYGSYAGSSYGIETRCIIEAFYDVCKEIGIAGIIDNAVDGRVYLSGATLRGIMKNVIKMNNTYRRLVKSGFAESVARETVLAEINENISKRSANPALRFYPRNDYKDTPEEEREKTKKVSKSHPRAARRVMTLDEFKEKFSKEKEDEQ